MWVEIERLKQVFDEHNSLVIRKHNMTPYYPCSVGEENVTIVIALGENSSVRLPCPQTLTVNLVLIHYQAESNDMGCVQKWL